MNRYDSNADRAFNCTVCYINTGNRRKQATIKTIAPAADLAMALAEKIARADNRRMIKSVYYITAIEQ